MPVTIAHDEDIAVVTLDNPPVNAIGREERAGLLQAARSLAQDPQIRAVVLTGKGRTFAAGADAREFDAPPAEPHLPDVVNAIEASPVPWIAAINGAALGGGLELALACDRRIAAANATLGLPEVKLGVVPGAGGTQRLPRLIGFSAAVSIIAEGAVVSAEKALRLGLADEIAEDPLRRATEAARSGVPKRRLSEMPSPEADATALEAARATVRRKARGEIAPERAIELVELACHSGFTAGAKAEREAFLTLRASPQAKALRHVFFAEREARPPTDIASAELRSLAHCVVVGGGTMGTGIAYALLQAGLAVTLIETGGDALARAQARIVSLVEDGVQRGRLERGAANALLKCVTFQIGFEAIKPAQLAIEAVFEDMAAKKAVFSQLDRIAPQAVLATNTSYLDIDEIALGTSRPQDVVGIHFFSPAHIMKLVEIVRGRRTSPEALATAYALTARLKKLPVLAGVCDGFIGNRILARYREAADIILLEGGVPWEVDEAMVEFGYAMGPYETQDLAGLDIAYANRKRQAKTRDPARRYVTISDRMVEEGRIGRKSGVGWYRYPGGGGAVVDPLLEDLIAEESHRAKVTRRDFSYDEIRRGLLGVMINEAAQILHEKIAASSADIDLVTLHGYGFPRWRGGLMHYAAEYGFKNVVEDLEKFAKLDPLIWKPSPGLLILAEEEAKEIDGASSG